DCAVAKGGDTSVTAAMLYYPPTNFDSFKGGFAQVLEIELKRMAKLKKKSEVKEYKIKNSPITYVGQAPPLFIAYSDPDSIVPTQQQTEMIAALKSAGRIFESYEVTGEGMDHGFILSKPDSPQSIEANRRMFAFMEKYLKGK
ncbi:MAG TPA: prolyl oligopeptidase family serine peptidase, partial [bacterium]|nr:prolyl oligopeptidase family serine peptidase [bacterium]